MKSQWTFDFVGPTTASMFIHQSHLRHVLKPSDYFSPDIYELEMDRLFRPGWHFLATRGELPDSGDFKTVNLLGTPILVRNFDGDIRAFVNVCAHRHCQLIDLPTGHSESLRCQYHGWEYDREGRTGKVPDARCFRPWDRDNAHLCKVRTERFGEMIYFTLDDRAPALSDYFSDFADDAQSWFEDPFVHAAHWQFDYQANWKIVIENSLESYHIPCLHQKSFGEMPPESTCEHRLDERFTRFDTPEPDNWAAAMQNLLVRSIGGKPTNIYTHHHQHPNLIFIRMDVLRMAIMMLPTSPTTTRHLVWVSTLRNRLRNPWSMLMQPLLSWLVVRIARQVVNEDAPIFAQVQRGMEHSMHPGVIGTREERLYAFQKYIAKAYGRSVEVESETAAKSLRSAG